MTTASPRDLSDAEINQAIADFQVEVERRRTAWNKLVSDRSPELSSTPARRLALQRIDALTAEAFGAWDKATALLLVGLYDEAADAVEEGDAIFAVVTAEVYRAFPAFDLRQPVGPQVGEA
jgi:hypothetical protein